MAHEFGNDFKFDIGKPRHESIMEPFMKENIVETIVEDINELENKLTILGDALPDDIKQFYRKIKSSSQEVYIKEWTLFSIDNILKIIGNYKTENIQVTDLGMIYGGMGHCKVVFYDPSIGKLYYRHDGGSNGWDREASFVALKNYESDINNRGITFETFLHEINDMYSEQECLF